MASGWWPVWFVIVSGPVRIGAPSVPEPVSHMLNVWPFYTCSQPLLITASHWKPSTWSQRSYEWILILDKFVQVPSTTWNRQLKPYLLWMYILQLLSSVAGHNMRKSAHQPSALRIPEDDILSKLSCYLGMFFCPFSSNSWLHSPTSHDFSAKLDSRSRN